MGRKYKNKDIASRLGLSGTLVSLVLNNKADQQGIKKETQERVLSLAKQMGFFNTPDEKKTGLPVEEKPGIIGMIVPSASKPFIIGITHHLQKAFSGIGIGFSVIRKDPDDQRYDRMIGAFKKFFSGLILVGEAADENTIRTLRLNDYPFVLLEKTFKSGRLNSMFTDFNAGSKLVADHIQKLGYKNVLIIADDETSKSDLAGIKETSNALGNISAVTNTVIVRPDKAGTDNEVDLRQIEQFLRPPYRTDIIIVMNADLIYPLLSLCGKRKLRVPQDIAIISMEEGTGFDLIFPPITCLSRPLPVMASKLSNMIWSEIRNSGKGKFKRQISITPELIIRKSCGSL